MNIDEKQISYRKQIVSQILNKLSGDDVVNILLGLLAAGTICYVSQQDSSLELSVGDKKIVLNGKEEKAA